MHRTGRVLDLTNIEAHIFKECNKIETDFHFEPLKITFSFSKGPMLSYPWINLDGLIAFAVGESIFKGNWRSYLSERLVCFWDYLPVPFLRKRFNFKEDSDFIYHCSISRFGNHSLDSIQFHKFFCEEGIPHLNNRKRKFMIVGGEYKLNKKLYPLINSKECVFYCNGDKESISKLCKRLLGIGKRVSSGNGIIKEFSIESIERDFSLNHPEFGINRPIPLELYNELSVNQTSFANLAYKPPNWMKSNHTLCTVPGGFI